MNNEAYEITNKQDKTIISVKRVKDGKIFSIGDTVKHYHDMECKIISFVEEVGFHEPDYIAYNYDTLSVTGDPYPIALRELELGKHFSKLSNII